ncbi:MAG: hypothetical protein QXK00_03295 [archaeon]
MTVEYSAFLKQNILLKAGDRVAILYEKEFKPIALNFLESAKIICETIPPEASRFPKALGYEISVEDPFSFCIPKEILQKRFNVFLIFTNQKLSFNPWILRIREKGAKIGIFQSFSPKILKIDPEEVALLGKKIQSKLKKSEKIRVVSDNGTDIEFSIDPIFKIETGLLSSKGLICTFPAGEIVAPVKIANGYIISDFGPIEKSSIRKSRVGEYTLSEFGIGLNKYQEFPCEKALKVAFFGFGNNIHIGGKISAKYHFKVLIRKPRIFIGNEELVF